VTQYLERRLTHKYRSAYKHLDASETIGAFTTIAKSDLMHSDDEEDYCESTFQSLFVEVEMHELLPLKVYIDALSDHYSSAGCGHSWDCCGCRSFHGWASHLKDNLYRVDVSSSRNF
jgi:hypothetical protein